jgi:hypothetical protein
VGWWRYDFALPFIARAADAETAVTESASWPKAGQWRCAIERAGKPVQTVRFGVNPDGRLTPHAEQTKAPRAAWLLTVESTKLSRR